MFRIRKRKLSLTISNIENDWIYAPFSGEIIPLSKVHDTVFSQKIMGDGISIEPEDNILYSPTNGVISMVFPTKHALGIKADNGAGIIIHIGINTVELEGKGFDVFVRQGDRVKVGDALLKADFKKIREEYETTTMITIENSAEFYMQVCEKERIAAGEKLIKLIGKGGI